MGLKWELHWKNKEIEVEKNGIQQGQIQDFNGKPWDFIGTKQDVNRIEVGETADLTRKNGL